MGASEKHDAAYHGMEPLPGMEGYSPAQQLMRKDIESGLPVVQATTDPHHAPALLRIVMDEVLGPQLQVQATEELSRQIRDQAIELIKELDVPIKMPLQTWNALQNVVMKGIWQGYTWGVQATATAEE